jgi:hypothetical protein
MFVVIPIVAVIAPFVSFLHNELFLGFITLAFHAFYYAVQLVSVGWADRVRVCGSWWSVTDCALF